MARNLAILRSQVESALAGRVSAPFTYRDRKIMETVSAGIPEIDSLTGGLPRGGLTEICGPPSSGRTSLLVSALAERTAQDEVCALVDGRDTFDPHSAEAAGVVLKQLLWVRCRNIDQALRATDLLIQGSGFGLIALDLSDIPPETVRYVPLNAWFRFRRAIEDTPTILVVLEQESNAKTCASLVLRLGAQPALWSMPPEAYDANFPTHPAACLLDSLEVRAEVLRSRMQASESHLHLDKTGTSAECFTAAERFAEKTHTCHPEPSEGAAFVFRAAEHDLIRLPAQKTTVAQAAQGFKGAPPFAAGSVGGSADDFTTARFFKTKSIWSHAGVWAPLKQR
jgi:recombination protein RecA